MLDHIIVTVSEFKRSIAFYERALKPLGITEFMVFLPLDANVQFMTVMATTMPYIGRG